MALKGVIQVKSRIDSTLPPPTNAPGWAVDSSLIDDVPRQSQNSKFEDPGLLQLQSCLVELSQKIQVFEVD